MNEIIFKVVEFNSKAHNQARELREEILYKARNIVSTGFVEEEDHIQIIGLSNNNMIATCSLVPEKDHCRMRYVAIKSDMQGKGVGSQLLRFSEAKAKEQGFKSIYCHARDTAIKFYSRNGFDIEGEMFEQVTIPHIKMRKLLG